jgi:hypothetical protein
MRSGGDPAIPARIDRRSDGLDLHSPVQEACQLEYRYFPRARANACYSAAPRFSAFASVFRKPYRLLRRMRFITIR